MTVTQKNVLIAFSLVVIGVATRLLPHSANITAIGAISIFAGFYLPRKVAWLVPLLSMFLSDITIGFYHWPVMVSVYGTLLIMTFVCSTGYRQPHSLSSTFTKTVFGTVLFYVVTNWAVWQFGTMYTYNFQGLVDSYIAAVPFLRNSFIGDMGYSFALYAVFSWAKLTAQVKVPLFFYKTRAVVRD